MVFSTIEFLFQFLPIFLLAYYATPQKYRNITLIIGSLVFYAIGSGWYTLLLLLSLVINYGLSRLISGSHARHPQQAKHYLIGGLIYNFGLLVVFKYTNFLIGNLNSLLSVFHVAIPKASIIMPLGISFFTFQITSYLIDVYQNKTRPARSLLDLGVYLCMFPQLISGPICMYSEIQPQMHNRRVDIRLLEEGMETFVLGLSAKTLLANPMGGLWNNLSVIGYDSISTPYAWLGAFAYSFQIYFDFSGYSMMAIGVGKMLGFELPQNFNLPYMSGSAGEFWRRWHITLGRWFKNYIYFPLGGSRVGKWKTMRNMLAVWAFTGLWHGASWSFVVWGGLHGLYQIIGYELRGVKDRINEQLHTKTDCLSYKLGQVLVTFGLTAFAWIFFRANSLGDAFGYIRRMFTKPDLWCLFNGELYNLGLDRVEMNVLFGSLLVLLLADLVRYFKKQQLDAFLAEQNLWFRWGVLLALIAAVAIFGIYGPGYDAQQFIYFQF